MDVFASFNEYSETSLASKIKKYENNFETYIDTNLPVIVRCDGRGFSKFTKGFEKPFDVLFRKVMEKTMIATACAFQDATLAYTQSDEISFLLEKKNDESDIFFKGRVQKIVSTGAATVSVFFNKFLIEEAEKEKLIVLDSLEETLRILDRYAMLSKKFFSATFDCRVFNVPKNEKYLEFIWRYLDCRKNAVQSIARCYFTQKELHLKKTRDMINMLAEKGVKLSDFPKKYIDGQCITKVETILNEGTNKECIRNKWTLVDAVETIKMLNDENIGQ